jgi:Arylsulfotransferase (ASST)
MGNFMRGQGHAGGWHPHTCHASYVAAFVRRTTLLLLAVVAGLVGGIATPGGAPARTPARLAVSATTGLIPAFSTGVHDYVVRCTKGRPVTIRVDAPRSTPVSVDGATPRRGTFDARVRASAGQAFTLKVRGSDYHVRCLPQDFQRFTVHRSGSPQAAYYMVTPSLDLASPKNGAPYTALFDNHGVPLWWKRSSALKPVDAKVLPNGNPSWAEGGGGKYGTSPTNAYYERSWTGKLIHKWQTVGSPTDEHDLQLLPNGDVLVITYMPRDHVNLAAFGGPADATVLDCEIQELAPDGHVAWAWNSRDHIGLAETGRWYQNIAATKPPDTWPGRGMVWDIVHMNAIELTPDGGLLFSARALDAVYKIDPATGNIIWKIGGTPIPQSLAIQGDPNASADFGGQHDVRLLPDGTITLFDNGTARGRAPRAMRLRLDLAARTASVIESVSNPLARNSLCCGSARRLAGGDWVTSWGGVPLVTEQTPSGATRFELRFAGTVFSYRAQPVPAGILTRTVLRAGMDSMHPRPARRSRHGPG